MDMDKLASAFESSASNDGDLTKIIRLSFAKGISAVNDDERAVAGYISRCVSRRRKCSESKGLLLENNHITPLENVLEAKNLLIIIAARGGLSAPTPFCFAVCSMGVQLYSRLKQERH